jgi:hypothetical protein
MKFPLRFNKNKGIALILTCVGAAFLIGLPMTYVLSSVQTECATVARSQRWNDAMVVAEAGVEEGQAFVNKYSNSSTNLLTAWATSTSASSDGWTASGATTNVFSRTRSTVFGTGTSYTILVTNVSTTNVMIKVTGTVSAPGVWSAQSISRAVLLNSIVYGQGIGGLISKGNVTLSGGAYADSFNSLDPSHSYNGQYDSTNREAHGDILLANGNLNMSGSSRILGMVFTGPTNLINFNGMAIGDTNWTSGVEPGWTNNTANVSVPDAPGVPNVTWNALPAVTVFGSTNQYILNGGGPGNTNYYNIPNNFNLSGGAQFIATNGNVDLYGAGKFDISGGSTLVIKPGATVTAWLNGTTTLSGGGVVNQTGNATNAMFYGTTNCTSLTISGSSAFIGRLDVPYADAVYSGSAAFIGDFVVKTFNDSGGAAMHYDAGLLGYPGNGYIATTWHEVPP